MNVNTINKITITTIYFGLLFLSVDGPVKVKDWIVSSRSVPEIGGIYYISSGNNPFKESKYSVVMKIVDKTKDKDGKLWVKYHFCPGPDENCTNPRYEQYTTSNTWNVISSIYTKKEN